VQLQQLLQLATGYYTLGVGGAIYADNAVLTVQDSLLMSNNAVMDGGKCHLPLSLTCALKSCATAVSFLQSLSSRPRGSTAVTVAKPARCRHSASDWRAYSTAVRASSYTETALLPAMASSPLCTSEPGWTSPLACLPQVL
jgi:hypothetical protein